MLTERMSDRGTPDSLNTARIASQIPEVISEVVRVFFVAITLVFKRSSPGFPVILIRAESVFVPPIFLLLVYILCDVPDAIYLPTSTPRRYSFLAMEPILAIIK